MRYDGQLRIPVSIGEFIDKISILEIKLARIIDVEKIANVRHELALLKSIRTQHALTGATLDELSNELKAVNERLWDIEDQIRESERKSDFGTRFIAHARGVYKLNDRRAALKRKINKLFDSTVVEEKSYSDY